MLLGGCLRSRMSSGSRAVGQYGLSSQTCRLQQSGSLQSTRPSTAATTNRLYLHATYTSPSNNRHLPQISKSVRIKNLNTAKNEVVHERSWPEGSGSRGPDPPTRPEATREISTNPVRNALGVGAWLHVCPVEVR